MGCEQSKDGGVQDMMVVKEETMMTAPSKCVVNEKQLQHAQELVEQARMAIEINLGSFWPEKHLKATQMITRQFVGDVAIAEHTTCEKTGTMYYIKVHTTNKHYAWIHVKVYEPPRATGNGLINFRGMKKYKRDCDLKTF